MPGHVADPARGFSRQRVNVEPRPDQKPTPVGNSTAGPEITPIPTVTVTLAKRFLVNLSHGQISDERGDT